MKRSGVLLLVVLSMLVLFTLIGVTFVLVASQSRRATRADNRHEQYGDNPAKLLDSVFAQVVRDTTNPRSALQGHSLLNDMYGNDGIKLSTSVSASTVTVNPISGGQLLQFVFDTTMPGAAVTTPTTPPVTLGAAPQPLSNCPLSLPQVETIGYFNGCVLTILDGVGGNQSARILGWQFTAPSFTILTMPIDGFTAANLTGTAHGLLINGRPFNGTGFGFNQDTAIDPNTANTLLTAETIISVPNPTPPFLPPNFTANLPSALMPNQMFFRGIPTGFQLAPPNPPPNILFPNVVPGFGGADEDYDALDPQNLALAYVPIDPTTWTQIVPSFHRPDTIQFLSDAVTLPPLAQNNLRQGGATGFVAWQHVMRQSMLRPLGAMLPIVVGGVPTPFPVDHPAFTGSNPTFHPITGPWDVDNDGDGITDSVWIDIGLPVQTAPDGRRFKPLAAIMCVDLDGRLNVNAHGNLAQTNASFASAINPGGAGNPTIADFTFQLGGTPAPISVPRGNGYGPPEINLGAAGLFAPPATYGQFFSGLTISGRTFEGRYGESGSSVAPFTGFPLPGGTNSTTADNTLELIKLFGYPTNYYTVGVPTNYGTPGDLWGRAAMGIDYAGQPVYSFLKQNPAPGVFGSESSTGNPPDNDRPNEPYTINLSQRRNRGSVALPPTPNDACFTPAELERILRRFDFDATALPDRLRVLFEPTNVVNQVLAHEITTDQYDLPGPSILPTRDYAATLKTQNTTTNTVPAASQLLDLLRARIIAENGFTLPLNAADQTTVNNLITQMVSGTTQQRVIPPEITAGQRFDLNRAFGNGLDDDGNGVVDEPTTSEFNIRNEVPLSWSAFASPPTGFDLNNDDTVNSNPALATSDLYARQQYAKYLYVLMMLLMDQSYSWSLEPGITPAQQQEITARRIAQWAINVVDYRDPDSIMTPFEYDVNPWNGWSVDGMIGGGSPDDNNAASFPDRRLVWGCEAPELLLTETLATHDRRVKDTPNGQSITDPPATPPDDDMDQVRIPEGSLFLELFCPHNPNASSVNSFSGDIHNVPQRKLNLGATPDNLYPVWRVAITQSRTDPTVGPAQNIGVRVATNPDTATFDPVTTGYNGPFHFSVFDPANASGTVQIERLVWFNGTINPVSNPDYATYSIYSNKANTSALLAPGQYSVIGPRALTYFGLNASTPTTPSNQKIELDPVLGTVKYTPANANPPNNAVTNVSALPIICTGTVGAVDVGVSVSEPGLATYYSPMPTVAGPTGVTDTYTPILDAPLDKNAATPLGKDGLQGTKLTQTYRTAILQRLANPLLPYDAATNPYVAVDWQPIDLFVFNGEAKPPVTDPDPADTTPVYSPAGGRERGSNLATDSPPNLWRTLPQQPTGTAVAGGAVDVWDYNLNQSLGFLNKSFGQPWTSPPAAQAGYTGYPNPTIAGAQTFHWIPWANRPFVSNTELLQVPATSAEQLMREFSSLPAGTDPFTANPPSNATFYYPCRHLLNFFNSGNGTANNAPYFYRLLEYVQVPSRFVDTETIINPNPLTVPSGLNAPFNKVSNYRDPGRVNINTIPERVAGGTSEIWNGILNGGVEPAWPAIVASRRGGAVGNVLDPVATMPTRFPNPFRTAGGAAFTLPGVITGPLPNEVNVTMMRPHPTTPTQPLFQLATAGAPAFANPDRNSHFRYLPLERLSNLLTTRSNVYAVWVTVGYFEVTPNPPTASSPTGFDVGHPDGLQLGAEVGSDSGNVKRHRAFYIYDRTIPVGFEPGHDHNIDKGILLKRYIE